MKVFLSSVFILVSFFSIGQVDFDTIDWTNDGVGFACSIGGSPTEPVIKAISLIEKGRYKPISKWLYSNKSSEQFLAVLILEQFQQDGKMVIKAEDLKQISLIRESDRLVPVCSGCTYWDQVALKDLLSETNEDSMYFAGKQWFKFYYERE